MTGCLFLAFVDSRLTILVVLGVMQQTYSEEPQYTLHYVLLWCRCLQSCDVLHDTSYKWVLSDESNIFLMHCSWHLFSKTCQG
jgi:hypothetical protein